MYKREREKMKVYKRERERERKKTPLKTTLCIGPMPYPGTNINRDLHYFNTILKGKPGSKFYN